MFNELFSLVIVGFLLFGSFVLIKSIIGLMKSRKKFKRIEKNINYQLSKARRSRSSGTIPDNNDVIINPATGLPMQGGVDSAGNPYGMNNDKEIRDKQILSNFPFRKHHF